MKMRNGFVSNSSSTSFCIFGLYIEDTEFKELRKLLGLDKNCDMYDIGNEFENRFEFSAYYIPDGYGFYVGRELEDIKDNQTMGEFKESIKKTFSDLYGKDCNACSIHSDSWYDG